MKSKTEEQNKGNRALHFKVWRFRNHFAPANGCTGLRNGTRVPKGHFAAAKIFVEGDRRLRNDFAAGDDFRSGGGDVRNDAWGLRNYFAPKGHFRMGPF